MHFQEYLMRSIYAMLKCTGLPDFLEVPAGSSILMTLLCNACGTILAIQKLWHSQDPGSGFDPGRSVIDPSARAHGNGGIKGDCWSSMDKCGEEVQ